MKLKFFFFLIIFCKLAIASDHLEKMNMAVLQNPSKENREHLADALLVDYLSKANSASVQGMQSTRSDDETLESIRNLGLSKTKENFSTVSKLLDSPVPIKEKISLVRIVGDFYSRDDNLKNNKDILGKLRDFSSSAQRDLASAATLAYSRLGYFDDTFAILRRSFKSGVLNKNDYTGELAHLIWFASPSEQKLLASELNSNNSNYSSEILANYFSDDSYREKMTPELKSQILNYLIKNEPKLSNSIGEYSISEALAYSEWLHAVALLTNDTQAESYERVIMNYIGQVTSNPKKTIAYLSSAQGENFLTTAPVSELTMLSEKIVYFADNLPYPQSPIVLDLVKNIRPRLVK